MVGSDHDLDLSQFTGINDRNAYRHLEIVLGADRIVRVNVDGECAARFRMKEGCQFTERNDLATETMSMVNLNRESD